MAGESKTVTGALNSYFNVAGDTGSLRDDTFGKSAKRGSKEFLDELRALSEAEKTNLAIGACLVMGWALR